MATSKTLTKQCTFADGDSNPTNRCPLRLPTRGTAVCCECASDGMCLYPQTKTHRTIEDPDTYRVHFLDRIGHPQESKETKEHEDMATTTTTKTKATKKQEPNPAADQQQNNGQPSDAAVVSLVKDNVPATATGKGGSLLWGRIRDADSFIANFGAAVGKSGLFGVGRAEEGRVLVASWMHNNEDPLAWKRRHHVISPKVGPKQITMHYAAMLADFEELGGDYEIIERSSERAAINLKYKTREYLSEITHEEISQEPYYSDKHGNPKERYATPQSRKEQLWARAVSDGVRTICSRVNYGTYTPEEAADFVVPSEEQPVKDAAETTTATADVATDEPAEQPEADTAPFDSESESIPLVTKDQLRSIKECKDALQIGADAWKKVLTKYNVSTAKDLTHDQADQLITNMMRKVDAQKTQDNLSAWAEGATAKN